MPIEWNKEASVIFWDNDSIPELGDFEQSLDPLSGERWYYAVEAYGCVYGRLMSGDKRKPWILTHADNQIHSPDDIRAEWPAWLKYVTEHGPYGR